MKSLIAHRKQTASFTLVNLLAIAPLWLTLAAANTSAHAQTTSSPADWTQFHRDNMQRWNQYETTLGVNNVGSLQLKWKNPIGPYDNGVQSSPAVVNGVVYFGSDDGHVYALDASTGATLWSSAVATLGKDIMSSSPAVANGMVYIGSDDNNLYALNASTGALQWSFATGGEVLSSPAVANGVVYFGSVDGNVYALNASTGVKLWSYATGQAWYTSPAVANGVVYLGIGQYLAGSEGAMYALNAGTGAKLWSYTTGGIFSSSPTVANGVVYFGDDNGIVYALNATTGLPLWTYATGSFVYSAPAVMNGVVYVGPNDGTVYALNASTGAKVWSCTTGAGSWVDSSPAVANGVVYVGSGDNNVYGLNASTGAKLWSHVVTRGYTKFLEATSPTIVDGVLYIRAGDQSTTTGGVYAFAIGKPADLSLRIQPSATTVHQGDLLTYAFPVWNLGPDNAVQEVLNTQVPAGTIFEYIRISGTPGLGTCVRPRYHESGQVVCYENSNMAPNTTWTVRLTVKVTAPAGTVITENAAAMSDTPDPNMANNMAIVSVKVQ